MGLGRGRSHGSPRFARDDGFEAWAGFEDRAEVRLGGQIPIQDSPISGEEQLGTKLGSDPQAALTGERVTILEFDSEEGLRAWATHPEHVAAKQQGRASLYSEYKIQVCQVLRESAFPAKAIAA